MTSYLIHETLVCKVTFVKRVTADDATDALNASWDGDSELIGVVIGDTISDVSEEVWSDFDAHIPLGMYPEGSRRR